MLLHVLHCAPVSCLTMISNTKRDSLTIVVDILKAFNGPVALRKMSIVYRSNLNFERVEKYLNLLLSAQLIEATEGRDKYRITRKGQDFISRYTELMRLLKLTEPDPANGSPKYTTCEICGKIPSFQGFWSLCSACTQLYSTLLQLAKQHSADPKDLEPLKEALRLQAMNPDTS